MIPALVWLIPTLNNNRRVALNTCYLSIEGDHITPRYQIQLQLIYYQNVVLTVTYYYCTFDIFYQILTVHHLQITGVFISCRLKDIINWWPAVPCSQSTQTEWSSSGQCWVVIHSRLTRGWRSCDICSLEEVRISWQKISIFMLEINVGQFTFHLMTSLSVNSCSEKCPSIISYNVYEHTTNTFMRILICQVETRKYRWM